MGMICILSQNQGFVQVEVGPFITDDGAGKDLLESCPSQHSQLASSMIHCGVY